MYRGVHRTDPVTFGLMVTADPYDGRRKLKKENGSPGRARTADLVINSHPLYQLSYRGIAEKQDGNHTG
jgi:hypothetical protein